MSMRKVVSCFVVFVILASAVPVSVFAVNDGKSSGNTSNRLAESKMTALSGDPQYIKFQGTAVTKESGTYSMWWVVTVAKVISGPHPGEDTINVGIGGGVMPKGYVDPDITTGDKVEVYGRYSSGWVSLTENSHYIKRIAGTGDGTKIIDYTISSGAYCPDNLVRATMRYKNNENKQIKFKGIFEVRSPTGEIYSTYKTEITPSGQEDEFAAGDRLLIRIPEDASTGWYDARLELSNYDTGEKYDGTGWIPKQFRIKQCKPPKDWSEDIRITNDPADSNNPKIAVNSTNNVHIVWQDNRDGRCGIYYKKLDNHGNTVINDTKLISLWISCDNLHYYDAPAIAIDSNDHIHIAWIDCVDWTTGVLYREVYYAKFDNNGNIIGHIIRVDNNPELKRSLDIAVDSKNNAHIVWEDYRDDNRVSETYYTKINDHGGITISNKRLGHDTVPSGFPKIAADSNNNIHIVWGGSNVRYTKLDNEGNIVVESRGLSDTISYFPDIVVDSANDHHVTWVWSDNWLKSHYIYYNKKFDYDKKLISNSGNHPAVAIDSNDHIHIIWIESYDLYDHQICYTKLGNIGNTLIDNTQLTLDPASPSKPDIAIDLDNNIHIVWEDYRDGNGEIYYKTAGGTQKLPVHNIDTAEDFAKIQEAVDDSDTEHGHTITVDPGTYNENVNVTKSLTIMSTSGTPTDTIVQAANSDEHVFNVSVDYVNISGFTVTEASAASAGIYLSNVEHCKISNNQLINNGIGICLVYSSNNIITSNNASNIWQGIWLDSSSNNIVKSNNASFNGQFGIWVTFSRNNTLITNIANSNEGCGIFLDGTSNSTVTANTVNSNKGDGIWLWWYSSNNTITANNISSNNCGIELSCYGNNSLYHNNFMDNVIQASDTTGNNRWNDSYPSGGNYWSDYDDESEGAFDILSGPNQNYLGSDGIADTPYDISGDAGAKDNYPLMEPWGEEEIDQLSPEANLDIILKLASYYDESNDYVSNNWNKAVELYTPALTDKERQDIQNELAKKFPKLDFTAEEIAEEIINFQYYISNIIIEGQTVTFTKTDEGTLVNDNGAERLLENTQIPFKKIELKASLGNCVMTVTSGDTRYSMMLETFCDLGGCGIEVNYDLDVRDVGIGASLTSAIFVGPGLPPIVISPGIYTKLSIDTPDHTITILLNDPFTLKNAEASAGIYIGYDLSGYKGVGGGVGVDAGTFVSLTPTDINPADVTGVAVDVAKTLSGGLSDLGGPQKGDPVEVAVGTGLDVIEKVTSSLPPSAKAGVELGAEGKLGLGLGAKVGGGGAKASVDGLGAVSSSTTMPLNIFGAVISPNKEELTTFYVSSIKAFPIIVEVYDVSPTSRHHSTFRCLWKATKFSWLSVDCLQ